MQSWFNTLTGLPDESPAFIHQHLRVEGDKLISSANGKSYTCGRLETPTLAELRERVEKVEPSGGETTLREVVGDVKTLHADAANAGALFQAASQFNLLEMASPRVTPEAGVGIYEMDHTQGPACAVSAGAGTIYRNYFAKVDGGIGQTVDSQINCLADLCRSLGVEEELRMQNGYAFADREMLFRISETLSACPSESRNELRGLLRVGIQWNTEVTLPGTGHLVTQVYGAAVPVGYSDQPAELWEPFARLILEASYEACLCAAVLNAHQTGNPVVYLTLLGGGVFGNPIAWIRDAIERAVNRHQKHGLDLRLVSYARRHPELRGWNL